MRAKTGYLEVIVGPMYSGKTEELIRRIKRAMIGKISVQVFNHAIDTRYGNDKKLYSHAGITIDSDRVRSASEILRNVKKSTDTVVVDEAQWFGEPLVDVVQQLLSQGKQVIIAGLALTYNREPFAPLPDLMALADRVLKLTAICTICGAEASFHKRVAKGKTVDPKIADPSLVSKLDLTVYQARCRKCFDED